MLSYLVKMWNLVPQKQAQIWGCSFLSIVGFWSPSFAQRKTLVYWSRINWHFGFWEKKYGEMEIWPLGNESSPFCRTEWVHRHVKIAFFHLSVWLIGQGGWKSCCRPEFHSWQIAVQAEKCCWAGNWKFLNFLNCCFNPILKWTDKTTILICFGSLVKAM